MYVTMVQLGSRTGVCIDLQWCSGWWWERCCMQGHGPKKYLRSEIATPIMSRNANTVLYGPCSALPQDLLGVGPCLDSRRAPPGLHDPEGEPAAHASLRPAAPSPHARVLLGHGPQPVSTAASSHHCRVSSAGPSSWSLHT